MQKNRLKTLTVLFFFIIMTGIAMAVHDHSSPPGPTPPTISPQHTSAENGILTVSANFVKDKVLHGSDGIVNMVLTIETGNTVLPCPRVQ